MNESGFSKKEKLEVVAYNYLTSSFIIDLIALIPWGYFSQLVEKRWKFFWIFKSIRISQLYTHCKDKMLKPIIKSYIASK